ncbi:MAG TPA: hypothetical protein VHF51_08230 [Solirubrobacteraceae bacterium]|nr:hypothetical protein [Solirubrobacteraceae bacterium]
MALRFSSLREFEAVHPARAASAEVDYGRPWRTVRFGPAYRAAWLPGTGELFIVRLGPAHAGGGRVELLAHVPDAAVLDEMLRGWREACGTFDSIRWLRARLAPAHPLKRRYGWALAG